MPDDIAFWKQERAKLQEQLNGLESGVLEVATLPLVRYLKTRICDLDRHIAALEKRRNA
jgi:hypothetical protein